MRKLCCDVCLKEVKTDQELFSIDSDLRFDDVKDICDDCNKKGSKALLEIEGKLYEERKAEKLAAFKRFVQQQRRKC